MQYEEKRIILKNGTVCILRSPGPVDAVAMLSYLKQTASETEFLTRYPDEVIMGEAEEAEFLAGRQSDPKNLLLCAEVDGTIIGCTGLNCVMDVFKCRHRAELGISVYKEFWNLGIGSLLLTELIRWAEQAGYEQLELEVDCRNERAVRLYRKLGFEIYGTREHTFKFRDGTYASYYLMLLPLEPSRR